jgi:transposase
MRAYLAELGLVARKGREGLQQLIRTVAEADDDRLPSDACFACQAIIAQLQSVQIQITRLDKRIHQAHRVNPATKRLEAIPGFGVIVSTAVVATMTDPKAFKTGREFAAWIGLVPRQNSTGGKDRLGSISKQGDRYLRRLLIVGALPSSRAHALGPTAGQGGRRGAGQQDGAYRLGRTGQGRDLSGVGAHNQRSCRDQHIRALAREM